MMKKKTDELGVLRSLDRQVAGHADEEIPEDYLGDENIFHRKAPSWDELATDEFFEQTVEEVERLYESGELSPHDAARTLGLSLREFVELFVIDEAWLPALDADGERDREALLDGVTEVLSREAHGLSARDFVEEYVLDEEFLSVVGVAAGEGRRETVQRALENVRDDLLGNMLRQATSVGTPLLQFVAEEILTETWFHGLGINDARSREYLLAKAVGALSGLPEYIFNGLWFTAYDIKNRSIPDRFVKRLGEAIAAREIRLVTELLAKWDNRTVLLSPNEKNAALLLGYYAQWIDFDDSYLPRVEQLLSQFRCLTRKALGGPLESAYVDMAEGLVKLHHERYDKAVAYFERAAEVAYREADYDMVPANLYYLARCFWKKGRYEKALKFAEAARGLEDESKRPRRVAAIKMVEGWLQFLVGETERAKDILGEAELVLKDAEPINHGNILSFYGRLELKEERYAKALKYFWQAILAYQGSDPKHRNVARTHANIANVYYLKASRLPVGPKSRLMLWRMRRKAFEHLDAAEHIYNVDRERNHRGLGKVHNLRALLYSAADELDRARVETKLAFSLGAAKRDHILMGRAKRIMCKTASDLWESFAISAEALLHAEKTDNRTLLARAYINLGGNLLKMSEVKKGETYLEAASNILTEAERERPYWREAFRRARGVGADEVNAGQVFALEGAK